MVAFDLATGRETWRVRLGPTYRGHDGSKDGPIATPTLDEGRVFIVGPEGVLIALDAAAGKVLWRHDLKAEYGASEQSYGFAASPLVAGSRLVVQVGAPPTTSPRSTRPPVYPGSLILVDGHLMHLGEHSGELRVVAASSSGYLVTDGETQKAIALDTRDGKELWQVAVGPHVDASIAPVSTPAVDSGRVFFLGTDCVLRALSAANGEAAWQVDLKQRFGSSLRRGCETSPFVENGRVVLQPGGAEDHRLATLDAQSGEYGFDGDDLVCLRAATGDVVWKQRVHAGSLTLVDDALVVLSASGGVVRVLDASPEGCRERSLIEVFNRGAQAEAPPSFASGMIFVRNDEEIVAVAIER